MASSGPSQKSLHRWAKRFKSRTPSPAEREMEANRKIPDIDPPSDADDEETGDEMETIRLEWQTESFKFKGVEERAIVLLYADYDEILEKGLKEEYLSALTEFKVDRIAKNRYLDIGDPNMVINQRLVTYVKGCFLDDETYGGDRKDLLDKVCTFPYPTGIAIKAGVILYTCSGSFHVREMVCRNGMMCRFAPDLLCAYIRWIEDLEEYKSRMEDTKANQEHDAAEKEETAAIYSVIHAVQSF
jgi:hypothetical protein